jgi:hypothetical protein
MLCMRRIASGLPGGAAALGLYTACLGRLLKVGVQGNPQTGILQSLPKRILGVFVTREHVRHNKSGITHRGKTRISH